MLYTKAICEFGGGGARNGNYIAHFCYYKIVDLKSNKKKKKIK